MENKLWHAVFFHLITLEVCFKFFRESKFLPAYRFPRWCCCSCQRKDYFRPESSLLSNQESYLGLSFSERLQFS